MEAEWVQHIVLGLSGLFLPEAMVVAGRVDVGCVGYAGRWVRGWRVCQGLSWWDVGSLEGECVGLSWWEGQGAQHVAL